ncbi:MAG: pyrroloquinoline quinone biosynthesis protein PqqB [Rhodocyclaceae bacterium]|nr:pyrroloquinoline quinone biosynthesis protein PqqB [Rhodocyclaceae bacterium]
MQLVVLGAAAGGGFPQWNCNCRNCAGVRDGSVRATPRTQSSICVRADGAADWALFNTSPDILQQIKQFRPLQPGRAIRDTGIRGIVLMDGQVDHTTGLYMLRERGEKMPLWCTDPVFEDLSSGNPLLRVLEHFCGVDRHTVPIDGSRFSIPGVAGITFAAMALKSAAAPYSPHRNDPVPGDNIGVTITDNASGKRVFYAPGLAEIEAHVWQAMQAADAVLVDGTFWTDDEMISLGLSKKRGSDIGHLAQSGTGGMLEWLGELPDSTRKVLIHINNTNPILDEDSRERAELHARGIEVAYDGMEICL